MHDLNEMAIFARVVEEGSFTRAAEKVGLPKSTVSRKISQLEERIGVRLLHRTTRQLRTTDSGASYYEYCARMVAEAEEADLLVQNMQAEPAGKIKITVPLGFGTEFFSGVVREFMQLHPKMALDIRMENKVVDLVGEDVDVAIRVADLPDSSMVARSMGTAVLMLVASPEYIAKRGTPETLGDLKDHDYIHYMDSPIEMVGPGGIQESYFHPRLIIDDMRFSLTLVLEGGGIAAIPLMLCAEHLMEGNLVRLLPNYHFPHRSLNLVYPSRKQLSTKVLAFIDFMLEKCRPQAPWEKAEIELMNRLKKRPSQKSLQ